ncbi:MAG: DUF4255 domain-containing protein [Bacteroidales bacterium]|nr:DUF4255 domain-containing protein [Bacteroidales bacterium]
MNNTHIIKDILHSIKEYLSCNMEDRLNIVLNSVKKDKGTEEEDIVITLLRIEQETSRKPQNTYYTEVWENDKKRVLPTSPDLDINLEVLISSHASNYESSLIQISDVVSLLNSVKTATKPSKMDKDAFELLRSLSVSIMNMTFEQHLSMWQTLGGNLVPSVAYKIRMVTISGTPQKEPAPIVQETVVEPGTMDTRGVQPVSLPPRNK